MIIFWTFSSIVLLVIAYSVIENRFIQTTTYVIELQPDGTISRCQEEQSGIPIKKKKELHIVQLSDLHQCCYGKQNDRLLRRIKECHPDLILITGDMRNKNGAAALSLENLLNHLTELAPCMYSLGNHELSMRRKKTNIFDDYLKYLKRCGIHILDNDLREEKIGGYSFIVAGYSSKPEYYHTKGKRNIQALDCSIPVMSSTESDTVQILLSHDPELTKAYVNTPYSLVFSGHLHGGMIRIFRSIGLISPRLAFLPKYSGGYYQLSKKTAMIVSRGLGSHTIKLRLMNRPELVHVILRRSDGSFFKEG